jgi:alcohol dehydrogenase (cytochrome c)
VESCPAAAVEWRDDDDGRKSRVQGDIEDVFHDYDAQNGKELWHVRLGSGIIAAPVTFAADGKQYVAILAGRPQVMPSFMGSVGEQIINATPQGGTLFVFALH